MTTQYNTFQYEIFCIQVQSHAHRNKENMETQRLTTDYVPHIMYPKRKKTILCGGIVIEKDTKPQKLEKVFEEDLIPFGVSGVHVLRKCRFDSCH